MQLVFFLLVFFNDQGVIHRHCTGAVALTAHPRPILIRSESQDESVKFLVFLSWNFATDIFDDGYQV